jgi:hypothetical protein
MKGHALEEVAAVLNANERSTYIVASLACAELEDGSYDLGACLNAFETMRIRALINSDSHPDDRIPLHFGFPGDIREITRAVKERYPDNG